MDNQERPEIRAANKQIAENNPWYVSDQVGTLQDGVYRHNMALRYHYVRQRLRQLNLSLNHKTVVDLGCGDGIWSMEISRDYPSMSLIGVDYNTLRLERYQQNVPTAQTYYGSCLDIPLDNQIADVVMFHQVLEHIPEPAAALQEVRRILKPDGWLMLSVPNEGTWLKKIQYRWIQPSLLASTDHVNFYTSASLRQQLETAGYSVHPLDAVGFYFPHQGISRRLLNNRLAFQTGVALARLFPAFRDCLFAWCRLA